MPQFTHYTMKYPAEKRFNKNGERIFTIVKYDNYGNADLMTFESATRETLRCDVTEAEAVVDEAKFANGESEGEDDGSESEDDESEVEAEKLNVDGEGENLKGDEIEVGNDESEAGNEESEVGNEESEVRNEELEVGNQESEVRNEESEAGNAESEKETKELKARVGELCDKIGKLEFQVNVDEIEIEGKISESETKENAAVKFQEEEVEPTKSKLNVEEVGTNDKIEEAIQIDNQLVENDVSVKRKKKKKVRRCFHGKKVRSDLEHLCYWCAFCNVTDQKCYHTVCIEIICNRHNYLDYVMNKLDDSRRSFSSANV